MAENSHPLDSEIIGQIREYERIKSETGNDLTKTQREIINFLQNKSIAAANPSDPFTDLCEPGCWASFCKATWKLESVPPINSFSLMDTSSQKLSYVFDESVAKLHMYEVIVLQYPKDMDSSKVLAYLDEIVTLAEQSGVGLVFLPMSTPKGLQVFVLSHYFEYNLAWVEFMLNLCVPAEVVASTYKFGPFLQLSPSQPDDKIAWLTPQQITDLSSWSGSIDREMPTVKFDSKYLDKTVDLVVFLQMAPIIGFPTNIIPELFSQVQLYYLLTQYFRHISPMAAQTLECDIYNNYIYHDNSDPLPLRHDRLSLFHADIANLRALNTRFEFGVSLPE